ncbi:conserved hypothetical protein [Talaromyces marneffei ATCC 18224]|uniref:Major facilitator superfamily (MFS) profile domain-containing protein n=1 Tax=Talaromyces marneffei (strain ATCC 18224 / CBS 334.59 / QM 7333) TaxID=441960 RepID=B6QEH1_TALMQ|nr:conserved hypothetical protein [Talaromyces marneffei ATCC 18224]
MEKSLDTLEITTNASPVLRINDTTIPATNVESYGVFLSYYLTSNTFPGSTYIDYALVSGLSISQALLISPLVTYTTRSYGTRTSLYIGACLEALSLVGASFSNSIWQLFLSQGLCSGWGMGFLFLGTIGVVPQWFTKRRSLAAGLASAGAGTGGFVYNLSVNSMIRNISLPWAYRILAIVAFTTNMTCASFVKDRHRQLGAVIYEHQLLGTRLLVRFEHNRIRDIIILFALLRREHWSFTAAGLNCWVAAKCCPGDWTARNGLSE